MPPALISFEDDLPDRDTIIAVGYDNLDIAIIGKYNNYRITSILENGLLYKLTPDNLDYDDKSFIDLMDELPELFWYYVHDYDVLQRGVARQIQEELHMQREEERRVARLNAEEGLRYLENRVPINRRNITVHDGNATSKRARKGRYVSRKGLGFAIANEIRNFVGGSRKRGSIKPRKD